MGQDRFHELGDTLDYGVCHIVSKVEVLVEALEVAIEGGAIFGSDIYWHVLSSHIHTHPLVEDWCTLVSHHNGFQRGHRPRA